MKLIEALQIIRQADSVHREPFTAFLACGFTPLHLKTFLTAHLQLSLPLRRVDMQVGLYGDLLGSIEAIPKNKPESAAIVIEWSDLDQRLGIRNPSGWGPEDLPDILNVASHYIVLLEQALQSASETTPIAIALPTLPLPPVAYLPSERADTFQLCLQEQLSAFAVRLSQRTGLRFLSRQYLDQQSTYSERWDVRGELASGFPYNVAHASVLGAQLAQLLAPPSAKKGLITDLDDTLWGGILGELDKESISWDLDHGTQMYALYQILLRSLSETGILIGAASKGDAATAEEGLRRKDMLLPAQSIYPCEVNWGRKSLSVGRILRAWNIAADSVVFVDDSPLELADVKAAYPEIECLLFPREDAQALVGFLERLRSLFGKATVTPEDVLRQKSLRAGSIFTEHAPDNIGAVNDLLREAGAIITLSLTKDSADPRLLDLVNKTNQFNLNGKRYTEATWRSLLKDPAAVLMGVSYKDKFSVLGKIAVLAGTLEQSTLNVDVWVMSCRAFSRQIEHRCLAEAFDRFGVSRIVFHFSPTTRNGPLQDFFRMYLGRSPEASFELTKRDFQEKCPPLFQTVRNQADG